MASVFSPKPFELNLDDINFILDQVNFTPLFDVGDNALINWDGNGANGAIFDQYGVEIWDGVFDIQIPDAAAAIAAFGTSYNHLTSFQGLREVTGFNNNLLNVNSSWGAVESNFVRTVLADYSNYLQQSLSGPLVAPVAADLAGLAGATTIVSTSSDGAVTQYAVNLPGGFSVSYGEFDRTFIDATTTITVADGGRLFVSYVRTDTQSETHTDTFLVDINGDQLYSAGGVTATPSTTVDSIAGGELDPGYHGFTPQDVIDFGIGNHGTYAPTNQAALDAIAANPNTTQADLDNASVVLNNVIDYTPRMITQTITTAGTELLTVADLFPPNGVPGTLHFNHNQIVYNTPFLADGVTVNSAYVPGGVEGIAIVKDYGLLETLGQQDKQNPDNDEFFIGAINPGVAPTNGLFAIFGQFFDHGLDFIAKAGEDGAGNVVKITIPLAVDDPLYGVIGPDGRPATSITISRATPTGIDENGDAAYVNHTSPQIDQGQTYGSGEQIGSLLREWVVDANDPAGGFKMGTDLVDGTTLQQTWNRWDGVQVNQTLVTINELRTHMDQTGRGGPDAALAWEDILNLRNRDATGQLEDADGNPGNGIQTVDSGQAMLLDINPNFDNSHMTGSPAVIAAVADLNTILTTSGMGTLSITGDGLELVLNPPPGSPPGTPPTTLTGASALVPFVDFSNFGIVDNLFGAPAGPGAVASNHDAVSEILLSSVGTHYFTGDGRVNENVGLTSIHHVFHEEHNFQVANVQTAILAQDDKILQETPGYDQAGAHEWQTAITNTVGVAITNGNVAVVNGHFEAVDSTLVPADLALVASDVNGDFYVTTAAAALGDANFVDFVRTPPTVDANGNQVPGTPLSAVGLFTDADGYLSWNQDKVFEGAKLIVEMEYQHIAVDQFAAAVTPDIPEFVGYNSGRDASITLEFAQDAYRYGHSTLRETIDVIDPTGGLTGKIMSYALEQAFLNPELFAEAGPGGILLGQSHQQMNEIDEFITPALNQGLLGLPLDLAAINIARGRDVGLPTLNDMRGALGFNEYTSWNDYGANMVHAESLVSFIAAYSFDGDVAHAQAVLDGAAGDASALLANFDNNGVPFADAATAVNYALNFMDGGDLGYDTIDAWMGGIAEVHVNGGLLGETFNAIFVDQITALKDGDRLYYLYRLVNQQFGEEVANGQFKDMIERTTGLTHLSGNVFGYNDQYYDFSRDAIEANVVSTIDLYSTADGIGTGLLPNPVAIPAGAVPVSGQTYFAADGTPQAVAIHKYGEVFLANPTAGIYTDGGGTNAANGTIFTIGTQTFVRDVRIETPGGAITGANLDDAPDSGAESHEILVGTDNDDIIFARGGDDTVYGEAGNDLIYGGNGGDRLYGGDGHDTIYGGDGPELTDGGAGDDLIFGDSSESAAGGVDQLIGGTGNDTIYGGVGIDKISGGAGDDVIFGGSDTDPFTHGGDGNDYVDGEADGDLLFGDTGDDLVVGNDNQDIVEGDAGDDILRPGRPSNAIGGGPDEVLGGDGFIDIGFDIIEFNDYDLNPNGGVIADMITQQNPKIQIDPLQDFPSWTQIEGIVGTQNDDQLIGDSIGARDINGTSGNINDGANWLIGGTGSDELTGRGGNDVIIGGSIRLDVLIGQYQIGGGAVGVRSAYNDYDAYAGASHRVTAGSTLSDGLLGNVALGTEMFDLHFQDFLKSDMFKDYVLGNAEVAFDPLNYDDPNAGALPGATHIDWAGAAAGDAGVDTVHLSGLRVDYVITEVNYTDANGNVITAYKVVDTRIGADPATGLLPDGTIHDGTDLVIGVEKFAFSDQTLNSTQLIGPAPLLAGFATSNVPPNPNFAPLSVGNAALLGITATQWQISADGGLTWTDIVGATGPSYTPLVTDQGFQIRGMISTISGVQATPPSDVVGDFFTDVPVGLNTNFNGTIGQDIILGLDGVDQLNGNAGNDWLDGGLGADQMDGGLGNDTFIVDNVGDTVNEANLEGTDTVRASVDYALTQNVENLVLTGNAAIDGTGNALDNVLTGNAGANVLDGGLGNDAMAGGQGNDRYFVDAIGDTVTEGVGEGHDTVLSTIDYTFGDNVEAVYLIGAGNLNATGNAMNNVLVGNAGDNVLTGGDGNDYIIGSIGNDILDGGNGNDFLRGWQGDDTISGGAGDDTVEWRAPEHNPLLYGGHDVVDGGVEDNVSPSGGDTFLIEQHAATNETYRIYAVVDPVNAAHLATVLGLNGGAPLALGTEIVITREVTGPGVVAETIIAELREIEEIVFRNGLNGLIEDPSLLIPGPHTVPNAATFGNDTVAIIGDFTNTNLKQNTITIQGTSGNDTVDITGLDSTHRIVFQTNGGNDTIIGDMRAQDTIEITNGNATDFTATTVDGVTTLSDGTNSITVTGSSVPSIRDANGVTQTFEANGTVTTTTSTAGAAPVHILYGTDAADDLSGDANANMIYGEAGNDKISAGAGNDTAFGGDGDDLLEGEDGDDLMFGGQGADQLLGGNDRDDLFGNAGVDFIKGGDGRDRLFGGDDGDVVDGGAGNDYIFGESGDDLITGGAGNDRAWGGDGNDIFVSDAGDGNDYYYGGAGSDTLDLSAILNDVIVDLNPQLGSGLGRAVSVNAGQNDVDRLDGIENAVGGAGNDLFIASEAANMFDGGTGNDTFRFDSAAQADGDAIGDFSAGDIVKLAGIDANSTIAGDQAFQLLQQAQFNGAGEVRLRVESGSTFIEGNTDADTTTIEFTIEVVGVTNLNGGDFNL